MLQESLKKSGMRHSYSTATGWQTIAKAIEHEINEVPLGYLYEDIGDSSPLLRLLRPNSLHRLTSNRAPRGMFNIPESPVDTMTKITEIYDLWYRCWAISYIPLIMERKKWFTGDENRMVNDVYFKMDDSHRGLMASRKG